MNSSSTLTLNDPTTSPRSRRRERVVALRDASRAVRKAEPAPGPAPGVGRLFRHLFLRLLEPMRKGCLVVELPEGRAVTFGTPPSAGQPTVTEGIAPEARIIVRKDRFFGKCLLGGDIGFGEAYMEGDWDSPDIPAVIGWFLLNLDRAPTLSGSARKRVSGWISALARLRHRTSHLLRSNSRRNSRRNIGEHYDLSNRFFAHVLDPSMMYSCAKWTDPEQSLEQAQTEKNEALCRSLRLSPYDHVLEIGTGWGGWSVHAARKYGCRITTITISEQQFTYAWERVLKAGVSDRVDVQLRDFRDVSGKFDKVVSIEMMEALGHRYLPRFCAMVDRVLEREGLAALQFITCPDSRYDEFRKGVDFIQKHVFPGSLLLSFNRVGRLMAGSGGFVLREFEDLGRDYARTLRHWRENFERNRAPIEELGFDEPFMRKWSYYLGYCEAAFAMRNISVVQALYSRANNLSA